MSVWCNLSMDTSTKKTYDELQKERDLLLQENTTLQKDILALKQDKLRLEEKLAGAMKRIFGSNSEHVAMNGDLAEQFFFCLMNLNWWKTRKAAKTSLV